MSAFCELETFLLHIFVLLNKTDLTTTWQVTPMVHRNKCMLYFGKLLKASLVKPNLQNKYHAAMFSPIVLR